MNLFNTEIERSRTEISTKKKKTPLEPPRTLREMNGSDSSNPTSDIRVPIKAT